MVKENLKLNKIFCNMRGILYLVLGLFVLMSCSINKSLDLNYMEENKTLSQKTKSSDHHVQIDSLLAISKLQSNHNIILFNSIYQLDGVYKLGLTIEMAQELGISSDFYEEFRNSIELLNE